MSFKTDFFLGALERERIKCGLGAGGVRCAGKRISGAPGSRLSVWEINVRGTGPMAAEVFHAAQGRRAFIPQACRRRTSAAGF